MSENKQFIETKEYRRFAEFCDACIQYKYIGICYGLPGVGKTLSSRHYSNWDKIGKQISYSRFADIAVKATDEVLDAHTIFCTAPATAATKIGHNVSNRCLQLTSTKGHYLWRKGLIDEESVYKNFYEYEGIDLIIIDEIDRLKL